MQDQLNTIENEEISINLIDVVKFEIKSVQANRWINDNEKRDKIRELKTLVPTY